MQGCKEPGAYVREPRHKSGDIMDGVASNRKGQSDISLPSMPLSFGMKLVYPEETLQACKEYGNWTPNL